METLGEKIYNLRVNAGISQDVLAEKLNVSRQTVSRWETDTSIPAKANIRSLCKVLGVEENYFSAGAETAAVKPDTVKNIGGWQIFALIAAFVLLVCCIAACGFAGYLTLAPYNYDGMLNVRIVNRFKCVGIVCISVGALMLSLLVFLLVIVAKNIIKRKK